MTCCQAYETAVHYHCYEKLSQLLQTAGAWCPAEPDPNVQEEKDVDVVDAPVLPAEDFVVYLLPSDVFDFLERVSTDFLLKTEIRRVEKNEVVRVGKSDHGSEGETEVGLAVKTVAGFLVNYEADSLANVVAGFLGRTVGSFWVTNGVDSQLDMDLLFCLADEADFLNGEEVDFEVRTVTGFPLDPCYSYSGSDGDSRVVMLTPYAHCSSSRLLWPAALKAYPLLTCVVSPNQLHVTEISQASIMAAEAGQMAFSPTRLSAFLCARVRRRVAWV